MSKAGPLSQSEGLSLLTQLLLGLQYLHSQNIIHRDIKLSNVFRSKEGLYKLGDFGVSKKIFEKDGLAETSVGTPFYLSPEVCRGEKYGFATDVWGLGCALFEAMTRDKPFGGKGGGFSEVVAEILSGKPDLDRLGGKGSLLASLIERMLRKKAEERPSVETMLGLPEIVAKVRL